MSSSIRKLRTGFFLTKQFVRRSTRYRKKQSSGRDLVIYCGRTEHQWNPELFRTTGFGGSEEAVFNLARELAKLGWRVTIYNNCGHSPLVEDGVIYRPFWEFNPNDKQDVIVLWRKPNTIDLDLNATKIFIDLHDAVAAVEFPKDRVDRISKIFVKTHFHRSLIPDVPDSKFAIVPNGIDATLLNSSPSIEKDPLLIINTSSPDRCMDVLPKLFRQVKARVPDARLQWAYGWSGFEFFHRNNPAKLDWMRRTQEEMTSAGIESLGRITQAEVGMLYQRASILGYPTEFAEIDCISVRKAQAASCVPIATDFGALRESIRFGQMAKSTKTKDTWDLNDKFHFGLEDESAQREWVELVVRTLDGSLVTDRRTDAWLDDHAWSSVAARWHSEFTS